jgi:hypothetical protein
MWHDAKCAAVGRGAVLRRSNLIATAPWRAIPCMSSPVHASVLRSRDMRHRAVPESMTTCTREMSTLISALLHRRAVARCAKSKRIATLRASHTSRLRAQSLRLHKYAEHQLTSHRNDVADIAS